MAERDGGLVAILLAAGASTRMAGAGRADAEKAWAELDGAPLVARPLAMLASLPGVARVVMVAPEARHAALTQLAADAGGAPLRCVEGGARRQDSVAAGVAAEPDAAWYLVHDAARPLASRELALAVLDAAREHGASLPGVPVVDTIKQVDAAGRVLATPPREGLRAAQTPQAFRGELLRRALAAGAAPGAPDATDCASLVERLGEPVWLVEGEAANVKVTTAADLARVREAVARVPADGRR
jgi:2-C-methyl-D-erythritol 4-phosphate cytidylyltransferase/2-C-methyl-D-erythritol 2,4-cyclodiphosphate synthase